MLIQPLTQLLGLALQPLEFAAVALRFVQRLRIGLALRLAPLQQGLVAALQWMANLGPWNYAIAFGFMITGLLLTMRWR